MTSPQQALLERYVVAAVIARDPDALAELFTPDGVFEAPLVPDGDELPNRLVGREAIRTGIGTYHRLMGSLGTPDADRSRYVLHRTEDPDIFIAEIDSVLRPAAGGSLALSLVQIFRVRDGLISLLRDYFAVPPR